MTLCCQVDKYSESVLPESDKTLTQIQTPGSLTRMKYIDTVQATGRMQDPVLPSLMNIRISDCQSRTKKNDADHVPGRKHDPVQLGLTKIQIPATRLR